MLFSTDKKKKVFAKVNKTPSKSGSKLLLKIKSARCKWTHKSQDLIYKFVVSL